jgi:hypothetical protein
MAGDMNVSTYKVLFITGIENLSISPNLGRGEKIQDLFITNDSAVINSLITPQFSLIAGTLEAAYLRKAGAVIYSVETCNSFPDETIALSYLSQRLGRIRSFPQMLWLVKDNAANVEFGFIEYPYKSTFSSVSRTSFSSVYTNAVGTSDSVTFSRDELRKARLLFKDNFTNAVVLDFQVVRGKGTRFDRALYFLQAARLSSDIGVKITNYSTGFEALFATDAQELSHKLSERIACFLETNSELRKQLFKDLKKSYSIRSKVVHGATGSKNLEPSAKEAVKLCDETLRQCLLKILEDEALQHRFARLSKESDMENYFLSLILG